MKLQISICDIQIVLKLDQIYIHHVAFYTHTCIYCWHIHSVDIYKIDTVPVWLSINIDHSKQRDGRPHPVAREVIIEMVSIGPNTAQNHSKTVNAMGKVIDVHVPN